MKQLFSKKLASKIIVLTLAMTMLFSSSVFASENDIFIQTTYSQVLSQQSYLYSNAAQIARLVQTGYSDIQTIGPFLITQGTLMNNGTETPVYLICISGTDTSVSNQTTGYWTDLLSGFEFDNRYNKNVRAKIKEVIPTGSNLIFAGHSLGGMIAQQCASDSSLKANYNILYTVTFGSPLINGFKREGTVRRLGDKADFVPYLSLTSILNVIWQSVGLNRESGGYSNPLTAHSESYQREDVWGNYDITGIKNGSNQILIDFSSCHYYYSPVVFN